MLHAEDFELPDQAGHTVRLSDYAGKWLVLYFYPEDDTPGCTAEACAFRDDLGEYSKHGLAVVGISPDSVDSHAKFAKKHKLNFPILSDPEHKALTAYGAWGNKKTFGVEYVGVTRKTFLINPQGEIAKEYPKVIPLGHSAAILKDYKNLS